jgi:hypothetical protein
MLCVKVLQSAYRIIDKLYLWVLPSTVSHSGGYYRRSPEYACGYLGEKDFPAMGNSLEKRNVIDVDRENRS